MRVYFYLNLLLAILVAFPSAILADCEQSPIWKDQPITVDYIKDVMESPESELEVAHLEVLFLSKNSTEQRLKTIRTKLVQAAILQHDGNRAEFRKQIVDQPLGEIVKELDLSKINRQHRKWLIRAYWLAGCTNEALQLLGEDEYPSTFMSYMPLATNDAAFMRTLADRIDSVNGRPPDPNSIIRTIARLIEEPDSALEILLAHKESVIRYAESHELEVPHGLAGIDLAIALSGGPNTAFSEPKLSQNPDENEIDLYLQEWLWVAIWPSVTGNCAQVTQTFKDLLSAPSQYLQLFRIPLEAAAIHCLVSLSKSRTESLT